MKSKHSFLRRPFILVLALGSAGGLSAASDSQQAVRGELARFWQVAEARVAVAPVRVSETTEAVGPVRRLDHATPQRAAQRAPLVVAPPPPTVEAVQSVETDERIGRFGLSVLGGLRIFDFSWGEQSEETTDSLRGRL